MKIVGDSKHELINVLNDWFIGINFLGLGKHGISGTWGCDTSSRSLVFPYHLAMCWRTGLEGFCTVASLHFGAIFSGILMGCHGILHDYHKIWSKQRFEAEPLQAMVGQLHNLFCIWAVGSNPDKGPMFFRMIQLVIQKYPDITKKWLWFIACNLSLFSLPICSKFVHNDITRFSYWHYI
jgi:hypothetical protein